MKIVVVGDDGFIGARLVGRLRHGAHDVVAASPATGVNTVSGEGLSEAMEGADVVVDVSNSPSYDEATAQDFFLNSGHKLMAAERSAKVGHHITLSIVGVDRMQESGYFRGKLIQEQIVRDSGRPHTIVRSTQFFEFLELIASHSTTEKLVCLSPALIKPIAVDDVVEALARMALRPPVNSIVELAGPHSLQLSKLVARLLESKRDRRLVVTDPDARYFGVTLSERTLVPDGTAIVAPTSFEEWLSRVGRLPMLVQQQLRLAR